MNPAHRDRVAFLRIVSGKFERGMSVKHVRLGKDIKLAQPQQFLAQDRDIVEEAFPGISLVCSIQVFSGLAIP